MRRVTLVSILLVAAVAHGGTVWCPNIHFALAWSRRTGKPVLAAGLGSMRGAAFLQDPVFDDVLKGFIPVEVGTYGQLQQAASSVPKIGTPLIVMLDPNGRFLKRLGGFMIRPADIEMARGQAEWLMARGDSVIRQAGRSDSDGNTCADAARALAMRGDWAGAIRWLSQADAKHASPNHMIPAWEALADDTRVSGDPGGIVRSMRFYRAALMLKPDGITESRIHLRLAGTMFRMGDNSGALEEVRAVLSNPAAPVDDVERAKRLQERIFG